MSSTVQDLVAEEFAKDPSDQEPRLRRFSVRQLSRETSTVLSWVHDTGRPAVITHRGLPAFVIVPVDEDRLTAWILKSTPEAMHRLAEADDELWAGKVSPFAAVAQADRERNAGRVKPFTDIVAEVEAEQEP